MEFNGGAHPECVNASNPYHECGVRCLEKIARGEGKKDKRKQAVYTKKKPDPVRRSITGDKPLKYAGERKVHPGCPKASNPYHECSGNCLKGIGGADPQGIIAHKAGSRSPKVSAGSDNKMKSQVSRPMTDKSQVYGTAADSTHTGEDRLHSSHTSSRQKAESERGESSSSSSKNSKDIYLLEDLIKQDKDHTSDAMDVSGNRTPNHHKDEIQTKQVTDEIHQEMPDAPEDSRSFSFSGITRPMGDSDNEEEIQSVISDSCVAVGNYHVRASVSSTLQSIINKHGDIAAGCQLESVSMRAYYLECLCSVVQELKLTSFENLTKPKLKEMQAILKDVESVKIVVNWLRDVLDELLEAVELRDQPKSEREACEQELESTKKELETEIQELQRKEQELDEFKARVAERRARMKEIELGRSRLNDKAESIKSKIEKLNGKSVLQEL